MTHDPLCPFLSMIPEQMGDCHCDLIARVRTDERRAALDAARVAVRELGAVFGPFGEVDAVAAIDALRRSGCE